MLKIRETTLRHFQTQLVTIAHSCEGPDGRPKMVNTIDPSQLRMAALIALQIATGDMVIPE